MSLQTLPYDLRYMIMKHLILTTENISDFHNWMVSSPSQPPISPDDYRKLLYKRKAFRRVYSTEQDIYSFLYQFDESMKIYGKWIYYRSNIPLWYVSYSIHDANEYYKSIKNFCIKLKDIDPNNEEAIALYWAKIDNTLAKEETKEMRNKWIERYDERKRAKNQKRKERRERMEDRKRAKQQGRKKRRETKESARKRIAFR